MRSADAISGSHWAAAGAMSLLMLAVPISVLADTPPMPPTSHTVRSFSGRCYAFSDATKKTTSAFRKMPDGKTVSLWTIPGWFRIASISANCEYFVTGYDGWNLIPDVDPSIAMLTFYRNGSVIRVVRLGELVQDLSKLEKTVSHYYWGTYGEVDRHDFYHVQTVDRGELRYDMSTGLLR